MTRLISDILKEIVLVCIYPILSTPLRLNSKKPKFDRNKKTIVIVERWISLNVRHLYWRRYLQKNGYNVYLINFPIWKKDFLDSSGMLDRYLKSNRLEKVTLVGISSGAVVCLLYLQELNGWKRVNNFVAIGAPFEGTWLMLLLSFVKSARELLPGSSLTKRINSYKLKNTDRILCIKAKFDEMVPGGSVLKNTGKVVIDIFGHNNLHLEHKATYKWILSVVK